ncbi:MAG: gephyrin-like molybdotransferase Glp, partial [Planctomycetota bacterium]
ILARDAVASVDVPAFERSAMDGYAVRAEDTFGATPDDPRPLRVAGESLPARPAGVRVERDTCVRIMTGAPVPGGADAVVPVEHTVAAGDHVRVTAPVPPQKHVGRVGEDIARGTTVLPAGRRLRPQDGGLLSSLGFAQVSVIRRPRVAVLVTGDEVLPAGSFPRDYSVVDANSPMLAALVERDGGAPLEPVLVADREDEVRAALKRAAEQAHVVLVSGGSSVGAEDHAPQVLRRDGELAVHGVAMRPSSPAGLGFLAGRPVFLLPGNPVSCLCAYDFFAGRAVRTLGGRPAGWPHIAVKLAAGRKIVSALGRTDYVRVRIEHDAVLPLAVSGASILSSTTRAHGFVIVPKDSEGYAERTPVTVHLY